MFATELRNATKLPLKRDGDIVDVREAWSYGCLVTLTMFAVGQHERQVQNEMCVSLYRLRCSLERVGSR